MEREHALRLLKRLIGKDLRVLADFYGVNVEVNGNRHKGWAGHALEAYLGLAPNSNPLPDFGTWDLKLISLERRKTGQLRAKETMAIDMINPAEVLSNRFEDSHLYDKFRTLIVVARIYEDAQESRSLVHAVAPFDLKQPEPFETVRADYELVRQTIQTGGMAALHGGIGKLVQPRTKGAGHGSTSKAFYARTGFVEAMLGL